MQQTIYRSCEHFPNWKELQRSAKCFLHRKNRFFSRLCQEDFTNLEVIVAHAYAMALLLIIGLAGTLEGGSV